jgi:uncharacterized repeat protein (TIGR01451 family)
MSALKGTTSIAAVASIVLSVFATSPLSANVDGSLATAVAPSSGISLKAKQANPLVKPVSARDDVTVEETGEATYIVRLSDPPLAAYQGGIRGMKGVIPAVTGKRKLDVTSVDSVTYARYLSEQRGNAIATMKAKLGRNVKVERQYFTASNGFAARMTSAEAALMRTLPGVQSVNREVIYHLTTDAGPAWIGASGIWDGTDTGSVPGTKGEGIVVGVIDTGINFGSKSFAETGDDGYTVINPRGSGNFIGWCNPGYAVQVTCNNKLIGAWDFTTDNDPTDEEGHGSHTASTAAGNVVYSSTISTPSGTYTATRISGVAPHANVIMYKGCGQAGCAGSFLLAAIDQIITDSVDVVNYSIGSDSPSNPWAGDDALAFLNARNAGIFVANSAGNAGPGAATVGSPTSAPWITGIAATRHNRSYSKSLTLTGGDTTPPAGIEGEALAGGIGPVSIVYAGAAPYNDRYCGTPTADGAFAGKIVVCDRGGTYNSASIGRVQKGANVLARGAVGMVLAEITVTASTITPNIGGITADPHVLPAIHIGADDGYRLKAWLATGTNQQATIGDATREVNDAKADIVASFSSRGPSRSVPDVMVPMLAAPGVEIWAAYSAPDEFNMIQGTSMASPHAAGAAALLAAVRPEWTPDMIRAAMMTTAKTQLFKEDGVTPADPFDVGAGRIDLTKAALAGFVLNETGANYLAADPSKSGDPRALNIPSVSDDNCIGVCRWTRVISSSINASATYTTSFASGSGMTLTVEPAEFTLAPFAKKTITITANIAAVAVGQWAFGNVYFSETTGVSPTVPLAHIPAAVKSASGSLPAVVDISTYRTSGSLDFGVTALEITNLTTRVDGLVPGVKFTGVLNADTSNGAYFDDLMDGVRVFTVTVPAGMARLRGAVLASTSGDMDLYLYRDTNSNSRPDSADLRVAYSASGAVLEMVDVLSPTQGLYFFILQNWDAGANPPDNYTFEIAEVASVDAGNASVSGPAAVPAATPFTATLTYNIPALAVGDNYYGVVTLGTDPANPANIGRVPVNVRRVGAEVQKTVAPAMPLAGHVVTYTVVIKNPDSVNRSYVLTDELPAGVTYVPGSVTGPNAAYDAGLNAVLISSTIQGQVKGAGYAYQDNAMIPGLESQSPDGGYYDYSQDYAPSLPSSIGGNDDNTALNWTTAGCDFNFYDTAAGTPARMTFSTNGMFYPRGTTSTGGNNASPVSTTIPSVITPNNFIAAYWADLVLTPTVQATPTGYLLLSGGVCPSRLTVIQITNAYLKADPSKRLSYQIQTVSTKPDEYWVLYDNVTGVLPAAAAGTESPSGLTGTPYTGVITTGRAIQYYRPMVAAPPITVTFQVTVNAVAPAVVTNTLDYIVNAPNTTEMTASTVLVVQPFKYYLPIVFH